MDFFESKLPATAVAPREARALVRSALQTWCLDVGHGDITELLASELVANTVVHVRGPMTVTIALWGNTIRFEVEDDSTDRPWLDRADSRDDPGRGMVLVDAFASAWGTQVHPGDGKTVWFELETDTPQHESPGARSGRSSAP